MRYLQTLQTQITPLFNRYVEAFEEVAKDVNTFLDEQLESDHITKLVIAGIVATPIVGSTLFLAVIMFSS